MLNSRPVLNSAESRPSRHQLPQNPFFTMAKNCANPAPPPNRLITLFCWVLDVSTRSFPVDLEDDRTVGHLKEEIVKKKPATFTDVDADELILWEVSSFSPLSLIHAHNFPEGIHHDQSAARE